LKVSHVLEAIGIEPMWAQGSLVFSLGIKSTQEDIAYFLDELPRIVEALRRISPIVAK
jgi:cysteine desulfurase